MKPDLPDRSAEVYSHNGELRIARVAKVGQPRSMHIAPDGRVTPRVETLRTWFVGEDGLTSVERIIENMLIHLVAAHGDESEWVSDLLNEIHAIKNNTPSASTAPQRASEAGGKEDK